MKLYYVCYLDNRYIHEVAENEKQAIAQAFKKFCKYERNRENRRIRIKFESKRYDLKTVIKRMKEEREWRMEQLEYFWAEEIKVEGYEIILVKKGDKNV